MILGYCHITVAIVSAVIDRRYNGSGRFRVSGIEINDHPRREIDRTEFGLPPSIMKGAFGNEGALLFFVIHSRNRAMMAIDVNRRYHLIFLLR